MSEPRQGVSIPQEVVHALEAVQEQMHEDVIDPETVTTFMHLFGYDEACEWLSSHQSLYFEALRRCRHDPAHPFYPGR
jgi:hypothetical protein